MVNGPLSSDLDYLEEAGKYDWSSGPLYWFTKVRREVPLGFHAVLVLPLHRYRSVLPSLTQDYGSPGDITLVSFPAERLVLCRHFAVQAVVYSLLCEWMFPQQTNYFYNIYYTF